VNPLAPHVPKLRALEALHAGQLSDAGRARVTKHLSTCDPCRHVFRGLRLHAHMMTEVRAEAPAIDFTGIELALRQEASRRSRQRRTQRYAPWLAVAAAALLILTLRWQDTRTASTPPHAQPTTAPSRPAPDTAPLTAYVTVVSGAAELRSSRGKPSPLTIHSSIHQGDALMLHPVAHAELHLDEGTGVALEGPGLATFEALRRDTIDVSLADGGAITSVVRRLNTEQHYRVRALGYTVEVRGTLFRVAIEGPDLAVDVEEGHVVVIDALGHIVADLSAPARYHSAHAATPSGRSLIAPRRLSLPLSAWSTLTLPALSGITSWSIDGHTGLASTPLAMRVPRGDVTLIATLTDGRERRYTLPVHEGDAVLEETQLRRLLELDAPTPRPGQLDAQTLQQVITGGTPALQRCYEHSLKQHSAVSGRLTLRFVLDARGRVRSVAPREQADALPEALLACIRQSATRWQFPPPGGSGLTFDAPIRLTKGR
jgi:FecR protein/Putative zinc-finger